MNSFSKQLLISIGTLILYLSQIEATPSSIFWTNCTTSVYETGMGHLDVDNYGTIVNQIGHGYSFSPDIGLSLGLFTWKNLKAEAGFDYFLGDNNLLYFNTKIGIDEDILFPQAPSMSIGIFNVGTRMRGHNQTSQNIVDIVLGKTLPDYAGGGNLYIGGFSGSHLIGKNPQGFMIAYTNTYLETTDCYGNKFYKLKLLMDYASGINTIGGLGVGIAYYFTPNISIETGPVIFNSSKYNGQWKYSFQLDIDFEVFNKKC